MSKLTSLGIVGKKKGVDELRFEEVWMKRIEILEAQYDQHVSQIQRRVLDEKFNKRLLLSLRSENLKLKKSSQELATHSDALQLKLQNLQIELHRKDASGKKLEKKLSSAKKKLNEQRMQITKSENLVKRAHHEEDLGKQRLFQLKEKQKKLENDLQEKETQLAEAELKAKSFLSDTRQQEKALLKMEEEKRRILRFKEKAAASAAFLGKSLETDEECMRRMNHQLSLITKQLRTQTTKCEEKEYLRVIAESNLASLRAELNTSLAKVSSAAFETQYWREEAEALLKLAEPLPPPRMSLSSKIRLMQEKRGESAETSHRISTLEKKLKDMENERTALTNQIKSQNSLHNSLMRIYQRNLTRWKSFEEKTGLKRPCKKKFEAQGSKTALKEQGEKLKTLERKLFKSQQAYNFLKFKLAQKSELENNLKLAEKALLRVEKEKRDSEAISQALARKFGESINWTSLTNDLMSHVKFVQDLRSQLPPLNPKLSKPDVKLQDLDGSLENLRKEIRILERKEAVFQNIQIKKDQLERDRKVQEEEETLVQPRNDEDISDSTETENTSTVSTAPESIMEESDVRHVSPSEEIKTDIMAN